MLMNKDKSLMNWLENTNNKSTQNKDSLENNDNKDKMLLDI
jgi:hypothetical protein